MRPYPLIARLVAAVRGEKEPDYKILADTLRHKVERYADKYPLGCLVLAADFQAAYYDQNPLPTGSSRDKIRTPKAAKN
jgi:hypothetical protein